MTKTSNFHVTVQIHCSIVVMNKSDKLLQVEEVQQWKNELLNQRRLTMERRLDRAEQKRQLQLQMKVRKAHEEETKVVFNV